MKQANPTQPSASKWLEGCLRVVIAVQCIGLGGSYLFSPNERESHVFEWLLFDWGWPEPLAQTIDNTGVWLTLAAGCLLCVMGWIKRPASAHDARSRSWLCWLDEAAAWWIAGWVLLITVVHMIRATLWAELILAEDAVRYVAPLALAILIHRPLSTGSGELTGDAIARGIASSRVAVGLLLIAASATFAAHGYKALMCYGPFTDLILLSDLQWTQFHFSQATVEQILVVIGVIDLLIAFLLIVTRWRTVALYMTVWGIVAAASRMTTYGMDAWPETLLRAANGGVPLAILGYWQITYRSARNRNGSP